RPSLGRPPSHRSGVAAATTGSSDAGDDTCDAAEVPVQGFDVPAGFVQVQSGPEPAPLTVARGHVTPAGAHSQRRWCPFGMATRVRGGTSGAVVVEIKRSEERRVGKECGRG